MKPDTKAHEKARKELLKLIDAQGLSQWRDALGKLIKPAIGLRTRKATKADAAVGATRVGGEPDLPKKVKWPEGDEGPLLFVMQVNLADVAPFDLEELLPPDGQLSLFSDTFTDDVRALYFPAGTELARVDWKPEEREAFIECGVDILPELHLPPHSSNFVGVDAPKTKPGSAKRMGSKLALPQDAYESYWNNVWLAWRAKARPGNAGEAGIHQMLGYAVGDDTGEQGADEEVLFGYDSDDRAGMEWGDVQCVWAIIGRDALRARSWKKLRAVT